MGLTMGFPQYQDLTLCVQPPSWDLRPPKYPHWKNISPPQHIELSSFSFEIKHINYQKKKEINNNKLYLKF